ncbi:MAG: UDP-N-acetylmuramoyl-L-alanyl-D-glutamate--2,6-diaminopimelate ligase [Chlorobi bacterium]|nr:UDP-N-acetylmuramoyl-L-alanyl-D-glutamate--2,6-diaminopimelate ligase [Chlorobiota bacterium]
MKEINQLLEGVRVVGKYGKPVATISHICMDSRQCTENSMFIAIKGTSVDGHDFIPDAIQRGARVIVSEREPQSQVPEQVFWIQVDNSRRALSFIAKNYYDKPDEELTIVGVTGTNGKTTVVHLLYEGSKALGLRTGRIGTIGYEWADEFEKATHTTPDPITLFSVLRRMADAGVSHVFMEVSSHALDQDRVSAIRFSGAIFTNISHDHLDYHQTMQNYINAKKKLFDMLSEDAWALVNVDDRYHKQMIASTKAKVYTYGIRRAADFTCKILEMDIFGTHIDIEGRSIHILLPGIFNVYNFLAAYGGLKLSTDFEDEVILQALSKVPAPKGRMNIIKEAGITAVIDYAHTPDALKKLLETIKQVRIPEQKIILVFGAGGDRDKEKRPLLGRIGAQLADIAIITSDNPRSEDPQDIIRDMLTDLNAIYRRKTLSIPDRREAIRTAVAMAHQGDIIVIAGKGHEEYQEIKGKRIPFSDFEEVVKALKERKPAKHS